MNETHMRELMELEEKKVEIERQKLAIQFAAIEVAIDDKVQRHSEWIADRVSGVIAAAVVDLKKDNVELKFALNNTRAELKADIAGVRSELKADIAGVRSELKADIAGVRSELKADIADVKGEIQRLEEKIDNHTH